MNNLLRGYNGIVFGVSNKDSLGYAIAREALDQGAKGVTITVRNANQATIEEMLDLLDRERTRIVRCDATNENDIKEALAQTAKFGPLNFMAHCVVGAPVLALLKCLHPERLGGVRALTDEFNQTMQISVYSFLSCSRLTAEHMPGAGSIVSLISLGSERVLPGYGVTGISKAAVEAAVRQLAFDLGPSIRVNALSIGLIKTKASKALPNIDEMLKLIAKIAPLKRNTTLDDVGKTAVTLLSDMMPATTGTVVYCDCGVINATT